MTKRHRYLTEAFYLPNIIYHIAQKWEETMRIFGRHYDYEGEMNRYVYRLWRD